MRQPVAGGAAEPVAHLPQGPGRVARVGAVQLTDRFQTGLIIGSSPGVDRGPWPLWWTCGVAGVSALVGWAVARRVRRSAAWRGRWSPEGTAAGAGSRPYRRLRR